MKWQAGVTTGGGTTNFFHQIDRTTRRIPMNQLNQNDLHRLFLNALRNVLARLVIADGITTDAEISSFISVWWQVTGESIDQQTARAWCTEAAQDKLPVDTHFRTLTGVVNGAGRDLAFKAAFVLCASDGALKQSEIELLNQMAAYFQFDRERVARLMRELNPTSTQTVTRVPTATLQKNPGWARLVILLVIGMILYSAVRYFMDRSLYQKGHQAYEQANCIEAVGKFDSIINGWRLAEFGGYLDLSRQEKLECLPFQAAVDMQEDGDVGNALVAYADFVKKYGDSALVNTARGNSAILFEQNEPLALASKASCGKMDAILSGDLIPVRDKYLPSFIFACGQVYDSTNDSQNSFLMYVSLLSEYSKHPQAGEAEALLLENSAACKNAASLQKNKAISTRPDFMPRLYFNCGQAYEEDKNWSNAIAMYEAFLAGFSDHALAPEVEAGLARSLIAQAKAAGAGEIAPPERSGSTGSGFTEVIIQNDSPERLRIVFSGPETRIEELAACSSCITYTGFGPLYCPEKGPIGDYTLQPGEYEVVVESISDTGVTPWTGTWALESGDEYYSCFFLVTTTFP
jgi:tetratricopeptide (TPR) repeat protein